MLNFFLGLRAIMLIGSAGAIVGSLLMFLQGGFFLHEAWHTILAEGNAAQKRVMRCRCSRPWMPSCSASCS